MSTLHLAAEQVSLLAAGDLFDMSSNLTAKATTLIGEMTAAGAMVFVLKHIAQSFTIVRLVTALLLGGLMIWGVLHLKDISDKADNTINQDGGTSTPGGGQAPPETTTQLGAGQFRIVFPDETTTPTV